MNAVLVLRFMRKHELDLVVFFVYGVVPLYLYGPKRTSIAPHSIAQLQIVASESNCYKHHNRRQTFLQDLQIDLPIRDSTLTSRGKKKPFAPEGTKGHSLQLSISFRAARSARAERGSCFRRLPTRALAHPGL